MTRRATLIGAGLLVVALAGGCGSPHVSDQGHSGSTPPAEAAAHNAEDIVFAEDMIPHHQQAVDMAAMVPTHTANQNMHVIAANIAADQRAEIKALNELLAQWGAAGGTSMGGMTGMVDATTMNRLKSVNGPDFDQLWLTAMIGHHQGAVTMAQAEVARGENPDAIHMANLIITAQQREIAYMTHLLSKPE